MYIGSAKDLANRLIDHVYHNQGSNKRVQNSIEKYGLKNFVFIIVEFCNPDQLINREQIYLKWLFSLPKELRYNFLSTADSSLGYQHTEEAKVKISETKAGVNHPIYGKTGELSPLFGKSLSVEHRQHISDSLKGRVIPEVTRELISKSQQQVDRTGANHPMYGKIPYNAHTIYIYSLTHDLIEVFPSKVAAPQRNGLM